MVKVKVAAEKLQGIADSWGGKPFPHAVVDGFFDDATARQLSAEFPSFDSPHWHEYRNPIEIKKTCNAWDKFPPSTYRAFWYLNSDAFVRQLAGAIGVPDLLPDIGLNGGGWHIHSRGGKLNPHLDYSIHPKLPHQRRVNLLVYLTPDWQGAWGGRLGFYANDGDRPGKLVKSVEPLFNRAVVFDTRDAWHGLHDAVICPPDQYRKSIALYFLTTPQPDAAKRSKALFAPTADQIGDPTIAELIRKRADVNSAGDVYRRGK